MMKKSFNKIMLVSLCDKWTSQVAYVLSQKLGMMFCDIKDLLEYDLSEKQAMEDLCSPEYVKKREKAVIKRYLSFENVVSSVESDVFFFFFEFEAESNYIIFLNVPNEFTQKNGSAINVITLDSRKKILKESADVCISIRKTDEDFVSEKIIEKLREIL